MKEKTTQKEIEELKKLNMAEEEIKPFTMKLMAMELAFNLNIYEKYFPNNNKNLQLAWEDIFNSINCNNSECKQIKENAFKILREKYNYTVISDNPFIIIQKEERN